DPVHADVVATVDLGAGDEAGAEVAVGGEVLAGPTGQRGQRRAGEELGDAALHRGQVAERIQLLQIAGGPGRPAFGDHERELREPLEDAGEDEMGETPLGEEVRLDQPDGRTGRAGGRRVGVAGQVGVAVDGYAEVG